MLYKICSFYKLVYFRLILGLLVGYTYIVEVAMQVLSKLKMKHASYLYKLSTSFFENTKVCKNKKSQPVKILLVKGWSVEGCITKVVEQIVMDFGLPILHKTLIL